MAIKWTKEQKQVIELRNRSILVSAAAGSGKTAVLVERIIKKIMDPDHPADIDSFLIVTFTKAAAAQMRERIREAIEKEVDRHPEQTRLVRQLSLIANAQITTIDSFCNFVIRNYFHTVGLEPDFRVGESGELKLLMEEAMEETLEESYAGKEKAFLNFVESFVPGKREDELSDMILRCYEYAVSHPWPKKWLNGCLQPYEIQNTAELLETKWFRSVEYSVRTFLQEWKKPLKKAYDLSISESGPYMYEPALSSDLDMMEAACKETDVLELWEKVRSMKFARLGTKRNFEGSRQLQELVKSIRNNVKGYVQKQQKTIFAAGIAQALEQMEQTRQNVEELVRLTIFFMDRFAEKKRARNILDFSDIEHFALNILVEEETGAPTEVAKEFSAQLEEIMIDEYQDSNYVQEAILTAVSRQWKGEENIFMVGDVKQSIYRFRMARPELFMEKYERFTKEDGPCQKVILMKNFRSRREIIDFVNDIFSGLMKKDLGNIEYDADAALYPGASYPVLSQEDSNGADSGRVDSDRVDSDRADLEREQQAAAMFRPEILLVDPKTEDGSMDAKEMEAQMAAQKIRSLMSSQLVTDQETGRLRPVRYSDIVILLRSMSGSAQTFQEELVKSGIPARSTLKDGYFQALEIKVVLNWLRLIDNPHQDIAIAAVLYSPTVGLTEEELAKIRVFDESGDFFDAVRHYAQTGREEELKRKLQEFLNMLGRFRQYREYDSLYDLLEKVLAETGYLDYISAMPGGTQREANVRMLLEQAVSYEKSSYRSLFRFIHYIDKLEKYEVDFGEAQAEPGEEDCVTIMSIHKSKGLEFPVVFLSGLGKKFNKRDLSGKLILHQDYGIGLENVDLEKRTRSQTLFKHALAQMLGSENLGEEMRVLYVALTRAKEKLILTGAFPDADKAVLQMKEMYADHLSGLSGRFYASSCLHWMLPLLVREENGYEIKIFEAAQIESGKKSRDIQDTVKQVQMRQALLQKDEEMSEQIKERLEFVYPYLEDVALKTKKSVSEIKHRAMEQSGEEEIIFKEEPVQIPYIPQFMGAETAENKGALRGTAMHRVMECFDFRQELNGNVVKQEVERMYADGRLSEDSYRLIVIRQLEYFFAGKLAARMHRAALEDRLYIEQPFVMGRPAYEIEDTRSSELILVQGIIDAFWEEDDGIVLLDYKTDGVENMQILDKRYRTQLQLYAQAVSNARKKPVKEAYIYSFRLGEALNLLE